MRLIDADALMEDLIKWLKEVDPTHPPEDNAIPPMEDIIVSTLMTIEEQPTIEAVPERKKGRWIRVGDLDWECTACGGLSCCADAYCPTCGAKMEGAKNE